MAVRRLTSLACALLVLALPAAALADGAGDQQYQDPLVAPSAPKKKTKPKSTAPSTAPAAATAPASSAPTPAAAPAAAPSNELPRTGVPAGIVALTGALFAAAGLALRRRVALD